MDIASKIKEMKHEIQNLDDKHLTLEKHISELKGLVTEKKKLKDKIESLKKLELELLAELQ